MSPDAVVFWFFLVAWIVVLGLIFLVALPRVVRQGIRIVRRIIGLVNDSPLPAKFAQADADLARINRALDRLPALQERCEAALTSLRTTPLVPQQLAAAFGQLVRDVRDPDAARR
jgi:hypothetical protein